MSTETNKAIVRNCWEDAWNNANMAAVEKAVAADNVHHFGSVPRHFGPGEFRSMIAAWRGAIPDYNCHIEELVAEGDLVVMRLRFTGTHSSGPLMISGRMAPPKHRNFEESEILMFRIRDEKIVDSWATWDRLSFLEQLGAIERTVG